MHAAAYYSCSPHLERLALLPETAMVSYSKTGYTSYKFNYNKILHQPIVELLVCIVFQDKQSLMAVVSQYRLNHTSKHTACIRNATKPNPMVELPARSQSQQGNNCYKGKFREAKDKGTQDLLTVGQYIQMCCIYLKHK